MLSAGAAVHGSGSGGPRGLHGSANLARRRGEPELTTVGLQHHLPDS